MSDGYTMIDYSGATPDNVTEGAGLASSYLDSIAAWIMLLPDKVHSWIATMQGMSFKSLMAWLVALYCLGVALYMARHGRRVLAECRLLTLTPTGMLATGINSAIVWCIGQVIFK